MKTWQEVFANKFKGILTTSDMPDSLYQDIVKFIQELCESK